MPATRAKSKANGTLTQACAPNPAIQLLDAIAADRRYPTSYEKSLIRAFVPDTQRTLDSLNARLPKRSNTNIYAKKSTPGLRTKLDEARRLMRRLRAALGAHPIHTLPAEVLMAIFMCTVEPSATLDNTRTHVGWDDIEMQSLRLSQVCASWRSVALATRRLWSVLVITVRERAFAPIERVATWLERSGNAPLFITLGWNFCAERHVDAVVRLLEPHAARIWGFRPTFFPSSDARSRPTCRSRPPNELGHNPPDLAALAAPAIGRLVTNLSSLRVFWLTSDSMSRVAAEVGGVAVSGAPLGQLEIPTFRAEVWAGAPHALRSLVTVRITFSVPMSALFFLLKQTPLLSALYVTDPQGLESAAQPIVTANSLKTLRLEVVTITTLWTFFSKVALPALRHLSIRDVHQSADSMNFDHIVTAFLTRSQCALTHLWILERPARRSFRERDFVAFLRHPACNTLYEFIVQRSGAGETYLDKVFRHLRYDVLRPDKQYPNPCLRRLAVRNVGIGEPGVIFAMLASRLTVLRSERRTAVRLQYFDLHFMALSGTSRPASCELTTMANGDRPAKRPRDAEPELQQITRSPDFWLEDGSVVLQVEMTQFRVAKSTLAMHSTVFRDMFSLATPQEEQLVDGCPVVVLSGDREEDWKSLLSAMHPKICFDIENPTIPEIAGLLRLSKKYEIAATRRRCIWRLKEEFPHTLAQFDRVNGKWTHLAVKDACGENYTQIINLAREIGLYSILPVVFYYIIIYATYGDAPGILGDHLAQLDHLSDQLVCCKGQARIVARFANTPLKCFDVTTGPLPCAACEQPDDCTAVATTSLLENL
ncbi:BTB domain-containing protein [Mycena kentingensis (nom. inval.)]|nr:BTB domain-containing protein [Mycena kentingensis (nom. inval.)]